MRSLTGFSVDEVEALRRRFWERVEKSSEESCWEWRGYSHRGYGLVKFRGRMQNTHRIAWLLTKGDIPAGLYICWTCRHTACLNPAHLFLGTHHDKALQRDPAPRFWEKVKKGVLGECWEWSGARLESGHGHVNFRRRSRTAHAVAWELTNEACILPGYCGLHRCDHPPCCNPAHIFLGTKTDNAADRDAKGRTARGVRKSAKLTETDIPNIRAMVRAGTTQALIAASYGVCRQSIGAVIARKTWAHIPEAE